MATKRKHRDEGNPKWWEALHKAQDWDEAGLSHQKIARRLEAEGYRIGKGRGQRDWLDRDVTKALDMHPKHEAPLDPGVMKRLLDLTGLFDPNRVDVVETIGRRGEPRTKLVGTGYHPFDFPGETEAEQLANYEAFKQRTEQQATLPFIMGETLGDFIDRQRKQRAYPKLKPRDWTVGEQGDEWTNKWLTSEDAWADWIEPSVVRHMQATAKSVLDLLDGIEGHAAERGQLRRVYLGLIRRLCMAAETILALKEDAKKRP